MDLIGKLGFDGRGWSTGLNTAVGQAKQASEKIEGFFSKPFAGGLVGGALGGLGFRSLDQTIEHIVHRSTEIKELSDQLNISTDEVQHFEHATTEAGLAMGKFTAGILTIGNARKEAAQGSEELRQTFLKFGITLDDLQNPALRDIDLVEKLARTARGMDLNSAGRKELRELLGGRGGDRLLAVFEKLEQLHVTPISEADVKQIEEASKRLERLGKELEALGARVVGGVAQATESKSWGTRLLELVTLGYAKKSVRNPAGIAEAMGLTGSELRPSGMINQGTSDEGTGENSALDTKPLYKDLAAEKKLIEYGEALGKLQESALKLEWERLNPLQRRLFLESQITEMEATRKLLPKESLERTQLGIAINEKRLQLLGMAPRLSFQQNTDSLARIGGLTTNGAAEQTFQDELLRQARRTADNTDPNKQDIFQ